MKVLLVTVGSSGDVHPFVGLGLELARRGHEVTLVTSGYFRTLAERAGLGFVDPRPDFDFRSLLSDADIWHPHRGPRVIMRSAVLPLVRPTYEAIAERYQPGATLVVASSLAFGARVAQDRFAIPTGTVHLAPAILRTVQGGAKLPGMLLGEWVPTWLKRWQYAVVDAVADRMLAPEINAFQAELGLPPARGIMDDWWNSPELVLGMFPDWFAATQPDWPPQTVLTGFPLYDERGVVEPSRELADYLAAGEAPIVFTPGSANVHGRQFFIAAVDACRRLGRRGLLLTRFAEQLPEPLPDFIRHEAFVPFGWLLPRAAAVVHHGGIGSVSQGLAAGIPQLIMPLGFDQFDNAWRVGRLGAGASIRASRFRGPEVARALDRLLASTAVAACCRVIASRMSGHDGLATAADRLEAFAASAGLPVDRSTPPRPACPTSPRAQ